MAGFLEVNILYWFIRKWTWDTWHSECFLRPWHCWRAAHQWWSRFSENWPPCLPAACVTHNPFIYLHLRLRNDFRAPCASGLACTCILYMYLYINPHKTWHTWTTCRVQWVLDMCMNTRTSYAHTHTQRKRNRSESPGVCAVVGNTSCLVGGGKISKASAIKRKAYPVQQMW